MEKLSPQDKRPSDNDSAIIIQRALKTVDSKLSSWQSQLLQGHTIGDLIKNNRFIFPDAIRKNGIPDFFGMPYRSLIFIPVQDFH
ncbi:hypothetical protein NB636_10830 [Oxalobacter aliiformigenes]|uniref:hypothetical protein n=1 Tax=Oxalobacter aliiformigenes TaxID=2946593 RepID=UPI0022AE8F0A|nr:hypothetical protein [Oxalobacter aliiformigenes]MCZ4064604.1 hypothetical protein [Oxalobacter aliiformigenes]WAV99145.1 hypothetical protein NB636_10830 [Oxalobacter aliiformigenes]